MEALKTYLKNLGSEEAREQFAEDCETTLGHFRNCIYDSTKRLNAAVCVAVEQNSGCAVRRWDLRPDDWWRIWPELVGQPGAPEVVAA